MRSSVSVILSSPIQDPNMSHPDYEQTALHHASILILVKHIGEELNAKGFNKIFERISKVNSEKITDSSGVAREIFARYIKDYTIGNNEWGDFQTHRRLLGLITVGKCKNQNEMNEICLGHESLKTRYSSTLFDSRCIIFGLSAESEDRKFITPSDFKSRSLCYLSETDDNASLEKSLSEFLSSLFWVLESKRQERSREKIERVSLLIAPLEKKDFVGLDMESRSNKKRCLGRMAKQLGDLCLQAGLHADALTHYHAAIDTLRSVNDWLWLAGACEGLSAASVCVRYPKMYKVAMVHRNSSLQEGNSKARGTIRGKNLEVLEASTLPLLPPSNVLNPEEICKSYRESIVHYSKFQNAGVIETEVCFKAARVAVSLNLVLQAATFLQNVIFINLVLPEDDKIERLMTLSELYTKLGFHRKASFYKRLAANRYVSARNPQTDWERCYNLMLQALPGHKLTLDPSDYSLYGGQGWGGLQKHVLQDVAGAARRAGLVALATRHMTLLLQVMWRELTNSERNESALQLQNVASQCEGSPVSLILDNGLVIPPANLLHIPTAMSFSVQKLKSPHQPSKLEKAKEDYGPFVFTPIKIGSLERKPTKDNKLNYLWVADEICQVKMELSNPLPFELEVSNMRLLTSGVVFESLPLTVLLPPLANNFPITLCGTPREVGELEITGYSTHTLGVKSNCRLKSLPMFPQSLFIVEVVPALPLLTSSLTVDELWKGTDLLSVDDAVNDEIREGRSASNTATMVLYAGEKASCVLKLENKGAFDIEVMEISVETVGEVPNHSQILTYDPSILANCLPLKPNSSVTLPIAVNAVANFVNSFPPDEGSMRSSVFSAQSGPNSFPSVSSYRPATFEHMSPNSSLRSGPSSLNSLTSQFNKFTLDQSSKGLECRIRIRYSGGPGLGSGYCRVAVSTVKLEIHNSILVTNWDVLPAETSRQFYMVLDFANMTDQEIELKYTESKSILIEEHESCRVPIPVDRCPLSTIAKYYQEAEESIKEVVEVNKACCDHISSRVEVHWYMGQRHGLASLRPLTLSSSNILLDIVRMSPINWEVKLNEKIVSEGGGQAENICAGSPSNPPVQVGQCVQVCISATNSLPWKLADVCLSLHFFQDYQNGICNFTMDTHLAIAGPDQLYLPTLEEGTSAKYEVSVVFFCAGLYKMNIQCNAQKRHTWRLLPPIEIEVKPPSF